jgi:dienelactone hydrolase
MRSVRARRSVAAALLLFALAGCGAKNANGSAPDTATSSGASSSAEASTPLDDTGAAALAAAEASPSATKASTSAAPPAATAPTATFATASTQLTFSRSGRSLRTVITYPKGAGRFPLVLWSHGLHGSPEGYAGVIQKIAAAGFVVAAPAYPFTNDKANPFNQADMSNQPADASAVITEVLKLDAQAGSPLAGHIETSRVGAGGHSAGGFTTAGLLSGATRDQRLKGAVVVSGGSMGGKLSGPSTPMLFIHGDADGTVPYASGQSLYTACPWPKAFLTLLGGDHGAALWGSTPAATAVTKTMLDFYRYSLYGDPAAKSRLRADATAPNAAKYDGTV